MIKIDTPERFCKIRQEYSDSYESMNWLTPEKADAATRLREDLINAIFNTHVAGPGWQFSETKLFTHAISPGCTLCGNGDWSCLFINGICNAQCFYCPSAQKEKGQPMTSSLEFSNPHDYADYVKKFNIKGVSFSGGEPFMTFDRVLFFLKTLRSRVSHPLYIWMYTNGLLVTEDKLKILRDHGLNEIRFDISANHYNLEALKKALGTIPCVTVEIPAIPEDMEKTRQVIKELNAAGVNYLNLHQLRCTPFNKTRFIQKAYTFLHGPKVTILETELAALELIRYSLDQNITLPINYCSFTYRHQFQGAGAQRRNALQIKAAHEDVTPIGHIRTMSVCGGEKQISAIHQHLLSLACDTTLWRLSNACDQLFFSENLWPLLDFSNVRLKVAYSGTSLKTAVSFRHPFKEVALNKKKKVVIERQIQQPGLWFEGEQIRQFGHGFIQPGTHFSLDTLESLPQNLISDIRAFESFNPGLAPYC
ncbi:MAG: radical SAM protein [Proteobacteria bacterium]|nr:radical SAM protein [Pseudomonadota bacterium]MBU1583361.1 radical SAM protein [Pseudomonadota bacterium]MBU2453145.1 radical SAM protein [Pseudomonadota bacterium]MBU2627839.1 radical SAM protein [Pseudomonadota bacterium]